jgi:pimeloyl-ACP methyl ester carboxylesterase
MERRSGDGAIHRYDTSPQTKAPPPMVTIGSATTTGGSVVAYEIRGDGPAVVLVHGLTESRRMWDPLVEPLAVDHAVVALDIPGHGESGESATYDIDALVGAVDAVINAVGVTRPLLVGHSRGGRVVTAAARLMPCRGVINIEQSLQLAEYQAVTKSLEPALRGDDSTFQRTMRELFEPLAGALSKGERARVEGLRRPRQDVVLATWAPLFDWSPDELDAYVRRTVFGVTVPYLSLHGSDPGEEYAGWLKRLIPGAVVEVWPGMGHYPHLVDSERFLARLRSFEANT